MPDGWWRDRAGAAQRLLARIGAMTDAGVPAAALGLSEDLWYPLWTAVLEGRARDAEAVSGVSVVRAPGEGDDAIAAEASRLVGEGFAVTAVTSDRALAQRTTDAGATARGAAWLLDLLGP